MYRFQLYISGEKIDLFKDETITLNRSVQNIRDISKVFTDFTQTFTIPASQINNSIFDHWYNVDITKADGVDSFDSAVRVAGAIELNHSPFSIGVVQLDKVELKNNIPYSYKVTFFGNLVNLSDLFGDDVLNDLEMDSWDHTFNSANVLLGLQGATLESGNVIYPLISPERNWRWGSEDLTTDIEYIDGSTPFTTNGIVWNEFKPAIKLIRIIEAIEAKYGITFSDDFFDEAKDFGDLFMWASRDKGLMECPGVPTLVTIGGTSTFTASVTSGSPSDNIIMSINPATGYEDVPYSVTVDYTLNQTGRTGQITYDKIGDSQNGFYMVYPPTDDADVQFRVQANEPFDFTATIPGEGTSGTISLNGYVYFNDKVVDGILQKGQMPNMKVGDFINSLFKMFNLTILSTSTTDFTVMPLDEWYADGVIWDINKYVKNDNELISRPNLNRRISFEYNEGETILAEQYRNTNGGVGYGDLLADFTYDGGDLSMSSQFENIVFERLTDQGTGYLTDVHIGTILDDKLEAVATNPLVFYNRGVTSITGNGIAYIDDAQARSEKTTYNNVGQENHLLDASVTNSLNFGSEINTFTLTEQTESLYSNYWQDYISDLYDKKRRIFDFKAVLPLTIITQINLNDILIIRDVPYIINNMNIDFTTGETKLQLLNYIGVLTGTRVNKFFEYDINVPL